MIIYKVAWAELTSKISAQELDNFYLFVTEQLIKESILAPTATAIATGNELNQTLTRSRLRDSPSAL
jgi:hypothetical protein